MRASRCFSAGAGSRPPSRIASNSKSNIRELEGSLIRLIAYASLKGVDVTIALAQEVLKNVIGQDERAVTVDMIQKSVADYYQLKVVDIRARNNSKSVALPRITSDAEFMSMVPPATTPPR